MTITDANAVNEIAREVVKLAGAGVAITPELEHGIAVLLINAHKALQAGTDPQQFYNSITFERKRTALNPISFRLRGRAALNNDTLADQQGATDGAPPQADKNSSESELIR